MVNALFSINKKINITEMICLNKNVKNLCRISIIKKNGCLPFVRVGKNDDLIIKRALDSGAKGIIVPMIRNKSDAKKAVDSSRYPPLGTRGVGFARAQLYGFNFSIISL